MKGSTIMFSRCKHDYKPHNFIRCINDDYGNTQYFYEIQCMKCGKIPMLKGKKSREELELYDFKMEQLEQRIKLREERRRMCDMNYKELDIYEEDQNNDVVDLLGKFDCLTDHKSLIRIFDNKGKLDSQAGIDLIKKCLFETSHFYLKKNLLANYNVYLKYFIKMATKYYLNQMNWDLKEKNYAKSKNF